MDRKHDVNKIDLKVMNVEFCDEYMEIYWDSSIGFGCYDIIQGDHKYEGYSEYMDSNEDKDFLKLLLEKAFEWIIERIDIRG